MDCEVAGNWRDLSTEWRVLNVTCGMNCSHTVTLFCALVCLLCEMFTAPCWYCVHLKPQKLICAETIDVHYSQNNVPKKLLTCPTIQYCDNTYDNMVHNSALGHAIQHSFKPVPSPDKRGGWDGDDTVVPKWSVVCWVTDWVVWFGSSALSNVCWRVCHTVLARAVRPLCPL